MSTDQARTEVHSDALDVAVPFKAAMSPITQWIHYPAVELCRWCFGTATSEADCDACQGKAIVSGQRKLELRWPAGLHNGLLLILPRLVDHYPDKFDDLRIRIRLLAPESHQAWQSANKPTSQRPALPAAPTVLNGPFEVDFPDRRLRACQLSGGYGHNLRPENLYTLSVGRTALGIFAESPQARRFLGSGAQRTEMPPLTRPSHVLPFRQLTDFQIWGPGAVTRGGGVMGGGFGLEGAAVGMLAATAVNAATTRTSVTTYLTIQCEREELTFLYTGNTPLALQFALAHVFGALRMAAQSKAIPPGPSATDPVDRLDKLGRLLAQGLLTEEEFNTAKRKILSEL